MVATKQIHIQEAVWKELRDAQRLLEYRTSERWTYNRIIRSALQLYMKNQVYDNGDE